MWTHTSQFSTCKGVVPYAITDFFYKMSILCNVLFLIFLICSHLFVVWGVWSCSLHIMVAFYLYLVGFSFACVKMFAEDA